MNPRFIRRLTIIPLIAILASCGSDSGFDENADFVFGEGAVQFVNMMPDSMSVTMQHGIQNSTVRFPFAEAVEPRPEDNYDWRIVYRNRSNDLATIIEADNQPVTEDVLSTFLFMGTFDSPQVEVFDTPIIAQADRPEGSADIWFASNVTYIDMVDIYLTDNGVDLATVAPTTTLTTGTFSGLISTASGEDKQLRITVAGTDQILFDSGPMPIVDQSQELFALVNDFGPNNAQHVNVIRSLATNRSLMRDASQTGQSRIANYTSVSTLDATYNGNSQTDIAANARGNFFNTGEGDLAYVAADDATILEETTHASRLGGFFTVYNFDNVSAEPTSTTRSILSEDQFRPVKRRALMKFINGSDTTVDLFVLRGDQTLNNTTPFVNNGGFGETPTTQFFSANLDFVVRNSTDDQEITRLTQTLNEEASYSLVFTADEQLILIEE